MKVRYSHKPSELSGTAERFCPVRFLGEGELVCEVDSCSVSLSESSLDESKRMFEALRVVISWPFFFH